MAKRIWLDGQLLESHQAGINVFDHGLLYGDGVFEGLRQYSGRIFKLDEHLRRLYDSAKSIRLAIPYTPDLLAKAIMQTTAANDLTDSYIRLIVTRGIGALGISPLNCARPSVIIIADLIKMYSEETYHSGMAIITASTIRTSPAALSPKIKSLNYLNNIMAKWEAIDAGVSEAVMLNQLGYVCECTADNIFMVRGGVLFTPPEESGILLGITRGTVIDLAAKNDIQVRQSNLTRHDLYTADECFLTGTGAEIVPVTSIDRRAIGDGYVGPITRSLTAAFRQEVRGATPAPVPAAI